MDKNQFAQFNAGPEQKKTKLTPQLREMIFLAEQAGVGGVKVLPGTSWAYHYKKSPEERREKMAGLLSGQYSAAEVEEYLKPDALLYDARELETKGLDAVSARIMNETSTLAYTDYKQYADFMTGLQGATVTPEEATTMYEELTRGRTQKSLRDALPNSGKRSLDSSLAAESKTVAESENTNRTKKVIDALKLDWLHEEMGVIDSTTRDQAISKLSGDERAIFDSMKGEYRDFVQNGNSGAYENLVKQFKDGLPKLQKTIASGESSESMQELEKELDTMEDVPPPGTERDPAIPPEDNDEYHTPAGSKEEQGSKEKGPGDYFFKIEPPLAGYYVSGKKSYFDIDRKVWSKKKQVSPFMGSELEEGAAIHTMQGTTRGGVVSIPVPTGYALDTSGTQYNGEEPKIVRDQNGCFYVETSGPSSFTISFAKEKKSFAAKPIAEDTEMLYRGSLSPKTETFAGSLVGGTLQKTEQIRQHILANHFYPGGGDLGMAQKVQAKLRNESTGGNYLQAIDASEYLECYSANTKFVAMLRKAGIPSRLVLGHHVEGAQEGKSYIDSNTGHAWAEVWDGKAWRRFDATPPAKPEDKKEEGEKGSQENAPNAEDGGVDSPQQKQEQEKKGEDKKGEDGQKGQKDSQGQQNEKSDQQPGESSEQGKPGEASNEDVTKAEEQLNNAEESIKNAEKEKQETMDQIEKSDSFKDLDQLKKDLEKKEMFDEMKETLEDAIEAKENLMKEDLKEQLEKIADDGFLEDEEREKLLQRLLDESGKNLDDLKKEIEEGNELYTQYEQIKEEIEGLVEDWFEYFAERLPRKKEVQIDEDSLSRQGSFNRRSVNRPRNILFGTVKNPRVIDSSVKPLFLASIMVDVSGSMEGQKLNSARKLLIFYSELFTRIKEEFGYINFAINIFSDSMKEIKSYDQEYDATQAYVYPDNTRSTVKARLMKEIKTVGGTNMLEPIQRAAAALSEQAYENPDYASAMYFIGDGGDTKGNSEKIRQFLLAKDKEEGFGNHMLSAILLGSESERSALAGIFGEEHTTVAGDFEELLTQSMERFSDDIEEYLKGKTENNPN